MATPPNIPTNDSKNPKTNAIRAGTLLVETNPFIAWSSRSIKLFRDLPYLWTIINQIWFFATPVIYDPHTFDGKVPEAVHSILYWNPTAVFIRSFRATTYNGTAPNWDDLVVLAFVAAFSLIVGLATFNKLKRRLAEEL